MGEPRHFRSQRFLDWPETSWGWRQYQAQAGAGDLFDMTIHRIDFRDRLGGSARTRLRGGGPICASRPHEGGSSPARRRKWTTGPAWWASFGRGCVGVWEGTTLAKGYGLKGFGHEWAEINGSEGSAVYRLHEPNVLLLGRSGRDLAPEPVPAEFRKLPGSPRDPDQGEPATVFRYDLVWEFVSAIVERREAVPSFYDGLCAQVVADSVLASHRQRTWVEIPEEPR